MRDAYTPPAPCTTLSAAVGACPPEPRLAPRGETQSSPGMSSRPAVLQRMPLCCSVVFDVLRLMAGREEVCVSIRDLAAICRLSPSGCWMALRRLAGANLIRWRTSGAGARASSHFTVLWDQRRARGERSRPRFPQKNVHPYTRESTTPGGVGISHADGRRRPVAQPETPPQKATRAHRWACAQIRKEVRTWPLPWPRRARVIDGVSRALAHAFSRGRVRPGPEVGVLVRGVLFHLRQAEAISGNARSAHAFGMWAVRAVLREMPRATTNRSHKRAKEDGECRATANTPSLSQNWRSG